MVSRPKAMPAVVATEGIEAGEQAHQPIPQMAMHPGEIGTVALGTMDHDAATGMSCATDFDGPKIARMPDGFKW